MIGRYRTSGIPLPVAILTAGLLLAGSAVRAGTPVRFFVSTQGDDAWSGRLDVPNAARSDGPFATLRHARDAVRRMRKDAKHLHPVTILVRAGSYVLGATLRFLPADGGSASAPVVYQAFPGGRPILRGGRRITGFVAHRGQISGPYKDEPRASWPIVEAPGAREHPVKPPR
jgi:hypothetical protein